MQIVHSIRIEWIYVIRLVPESIVRSHRKNFLTFNSASLLHTLELFLRSLSRQHNTHTQRETNVVVRAHTAYATLVVLIYKYFSLLHSVLFYFSFTSVSKFVETIFSSLFFLLLLFSRRSVRYGVAHKILRKIEEKERTSETSK